jgi:hypothetical protein
MKEVLIDTGVSHREDLIENLASILKQDSFCSGLSPDLSRIEKLLTRLDSGITFFLEYPYVDRHYRDNYYSYHAVKFHRTGRDCIRVHLFQTSEILTEDLYKKDSSLKEKYLGFFIVRPLYKYPLGRSLLSPRALKAERRNFICCLMHSHVSILGNQFDVYGFPHVAQDTETHSCAESSLWSFMEYFGSKYSQYKPLLPSQIYQSIISVSERRLLPSGGLNRHEIAKCLQNNGYHCKTYQVRQDADSDNAVFQLLKIYIESGIPLLLLLSKDVGSGHALLAIGHESNLSYSVPDDKTWIDSSEINKQLVLIDDNMSPYQISKITNPTPYKNYKIYAFIVPLPNHMFLSAEKAYSLTTAIFNDRSVGLWRFGTNKWLTRLLLTNSRSFKKYLMQTEDHLDENFKKLLLHLALPRFIWISEIYTEEEIKIGICSGLLIIDATGNSNTLTSVLWYTITNKKIDHDGTIWNTEHMDIKPFRMKTYQNNLKGEWNQWLM